MIILFTFGFGFFIFQIKMDNKNIFDKFALLMDQNIRGVQYGVYAVAGIGLCVALRSVRPFKKFQNAADIPKQFLQKRMRFSGKVLKIQGGKYPTLFVDHYPVIALPMRRANESGLPVQISSIEVLPNGTIWLNSLLQDSEVSFIPIKANKQTIESIVYRGKQDIGQHLVSIGFATVGPLDFSQDKDRIYSKYYKSLIATEQKAEKKGAGVWQDQRQVGIMRKFRDIFTRLRYSFA